MKNLFFLAALFLVFSNISAQNENEKKESKDEKIKISEEILKHFENNEFDSIVKKYEYTSDVAQVLTSSMLEQAWNGLYTQVGKFEKSEGVTIQEQGENKIVINKCKFEKGNLNLILTFDVENKIAGLRFIPVNP